ncbi:MAG TPA: ABC transporter ATP-binding protein [Ktedonobacterales bacterium]|nr:ABC transporter ATP-binding protein [Ktedonobacterales bacterium]
MLTTSKSSQTAYPAVDTSELAIVVSECSVRYRLPTERISTMKEQVIRQITRRTVKYNEFWALRKVNLQIRRGEAVALVGRNGAGKSTLLKCIAKVQRPTTGRIWVRGSMAPIIELGAGFHPELTGRENIYLNGAMLGFSHAEMERKVDSIIEFSELANFIESPLRTYSSGMHARLGFAVAAEADPDVLIIDEVLSVGDEAFQRKCMERMRRFRQRGTTILYVTHALDSIADLCDHAAWIDGGRLRYYGDAQRVVGMFRDSMEHDADLAETQRMQVVRVPAKKSR